MVENLNGFIFYRRKAFYRSGYIGVNFRFYMLEVMDKANASNRPVKRGVGQFNASNDDTGTEIGKIMFFAKSKERKELDRLADENKKATNDLIKKLTNTMEFTIKELEKNLKSGGKNVG